MVEDEDEDDPLWNDCEVRVTGCVLRGEDQTILKVLHFVTRTAQPAPRNPQPELRNYPFGSHPGALTINTGTHAERTIFSATLPITQRLTPERP